jgi:YVTN family beta-propeller protein
VYVIAQSTGDATVVPISVATNTVGTPIDVGAAANGMAITPDGSTLYVSDAVDQVVTPVTLPAGVVGKPIQVHPSVGSIAITPNGRRAYAADGADSVVIPINLTSKTAGKPIGVGTGGPFGIAITPDGKTVYVADEDTGTVTPIAVRTNTAGAPIKVGGGPSGVVVGPAGKTVYVTNQNTGGVTPINVRSGVPGSLIGSDRCPIGIAITPDQPPVAAFSERVRPHGHASRFNASASYPQSTPIATYAWNWGDGQRTRTTSPVTTHTYQEKGHHRVTLTVTDTAGTSTTQVFTGQTMSRNGSRIAQAVKTITIA